MNNSIFYDTTSLSLPEKIEILIDAHQLCKRWWVDKLDCSVSFRRQLINMTFNEILSKLTKSCHFVIIHRCYEWDEYIEIGFATMRGSPTYYLFIILDIQYLKRFTDDRNLLV